MSLKEEKRIVTELLKRLRQRHQRAQHDLKNVGEQIYVLEKVEAQLEAALLAEANQTDS